MIDISILLFVIAVVIPAPTISKVPPKDIVLLLEDSSPKVIDECCKLAFDILAEPDKFEFVNPVIVLLSASFIVLW